MKIKDINVVEIIEHYIPLKKSGKSYIGRCPFHEERTGSFRVSPEFNRWKCFGCDEAGDAIDFIKKIDKVDFGEAIEKAAEILHERIDYQKNEKFKILFDNQRKLHEIYKDFSRDSLEFKNYLEKRGVREDELLYVGYVPNLDKLMASEHKDFLIEMGIIEKRPEGYFAPLFNRISFALINKSGKICGFSYRSIVFNAKYPKYILSKSSPIFNKSKCFFAQSSTVIAMKRAGQVLIVEGLFDAIVGNRYTPTIAVCGSKLDRNLLVHLKIIEPDVAITLGFDNDNAGTKATIDAIEQCFMEGINNLQVMSLKRFKDLGDLGKVINSMQDLRDNIILERAYNWYVEKLLDLMPNLLHKKINQFRFNHEIFTHLEIALQAYGIKADEVKVEKKHSIKSFLDNSIERLLYSMVKRSDFLYIAKNMLNGDELGKYKDFYLRLVEKGDFDANASFLFKGYEILEEQYFIKGIEILKNKYDRGIKIELLKKGKILPLINIYDSNLQRRMIDGS